MQRIISLLLLTGVSLFAGTIPIPVSGTGTWACSEIDSVFAFMMSISGSNGTDTVSATFGGEHGPPCLYNSTILGGGEPGFASIDGVQSSGLFNASVGGGGGQVTLFDSNFQILAQVNVIGYLSYTFIQDDPGDSHGNITISSTPEPLTGAMIFAGISALAMLQRLRHTRHHGRCGYWFAQINRNSSAARKV
jgi:hypothetical protein